MKIQVPKEELETNDMYIFHDYGGYGLLSGALSTGMITADIAESDTGSDIGDVGGGEMGGGGDALKK